MNSFNEIINQLEEDDEPISKARYPKRLEPTTKYDYCEKFARIIDKPIGYVLNKTKGWPLDWLIHLDSDQKADQNPAMRIGWWLKKSNEPEKR